MDLAQDFLTSPPRLARFRRSTTSVSSLPAISPGSLGLPSFASRDKGERLYKMIHERVAARVLGHGAREEGGAA
jgi:hypothetical protein